MRTSIKTLQHQGAKGRAGSTGRALALARARARVLARARARARARVLARAHAGTCSVVFVCVPLRLRVCAAVFMGASLNASVRMVGDGLVV